MKSATPVERRSRLLVNTTASILIALSLSAALLTSAAAAETQPAAGNDETRLAMRKIFDALTGAFALSLDEEAFAASGNRSSIMSALSALEAESSRLHGHGGETRAEYEYLRATLAQDAHDALKYFKRKDHEAARITLRQLTESCLACHSRLPNEGDFPLGVRLLEDPRVKSLPREERVRVEVLARQFESALNSYESILNSPASMPAEVYFMGAFEGYLKVCLRVRGEVDRATRTLETFRRRPDVPRYLKEYTTTWLEGLRSLPEPPPADQALARARELVKAGNEVQLYPGDRRGLVHYVAASGVLHRFLETGAPKQEERCEAYSLLGLSELGISKLSWLSEADNFLEAAIRTCPHSPEALRAYFALEEHVLTAYAGSAGLNLPPEEKARLDELWRLVGKP